VIKDKKKLYEKKREEKKINDYKIFLVAVAEEMK
jgi:hypothetical protein